MSPLSLNLDPDTLRWVADDHIAKAELDEAAAERLRVAGGQWSDSRRDVLIGHAYDHRSEAKRLRAIATRIERRR